MKQFGLAELAINKILLFPEKGREGLFQLNHSRLILHEIHEHLYWKEAKRVVFKAFPCN
jgi:hypothetical protein